MPSGLGIDHTKNADGSITVGTSAQDIRLVQGKLYTEGIISGADVQTTTGLGYTIAPGLVNLWYAGDSESRECVLVPVPGLTVNTTAGPASGTRTDYVWVRQNPPSSDTSSGSQVTVGVSPTNPRPNMSAPGEYFILDTFSVPAGMTSTNSATRSQSRVFSVPYGSAELLLQKVDPYNGFLRDKPGGLANLTGTINLSADQLIEFNCGVTAEIDGAAVFDAVYASLYVDGIAIARWNTSVLSEWAATHNWTAIKELSAGTHTIELRRSETQGTGKIKMSYSAAGVPGSYFYVKSLGIAS